MASNPSMVIRVAATIEELKANLKSGISQIETTTASMQKMAASLSGDKLIQSAHNITAAVNQIGGASKLTEAEQARVNATLEKALEKYRALGREAPPGMQKLADETKQVDKASSGLTDTVKGMVAGFAAMFTARAAFNFVKSTVAEASSLKDLAQQTHINVEELQLLAGAMSEFGVDADVLGKGLFTLSRKISKGDDSVSDALKQMGMELKDVEGLNGEELFLTIMRGLSKLQGGLRDETASELFGSRLGMAMAGASEDIEDTLATWKRFNTVMDTDTVNSLDEADEAIKRMSKSLGMVAANLMGPVAEGFNVLFKAQLDGMSNWDYMIANAKDLAASLTGTGTGTENLTRLLDGLNQKTEAAKTSTQGATKAQREFTPALDDTAGATKRARDEQAALAKQVAETEKAYARLMSEVKNANQLAIMEAEAAQMKQNAEQQAMFDDLDIKARIKRQQVINDQSSAEEAAETARVAANQSEIDGIMAAAAAHQDAGAVAKTATDQTMAGYAGIAQQVTVTGDAIRELINLSKYSMAANAILSENSLFTSRSQMERVAALPTPRALGGPVSAGAPYMVGERGPELFVPERSGTIVPNGGGGAPVNISVTVNGSVLGSQEGIARLVGDAVMRSMRDQGFRAGAA